MSLSLLSPPSAELIALAAAKDHLRITGDSDDGAVASALAAAVRAVEQRAGLALAPQQWRWTLDAAPAGAVSLPIAPVISIDAISVVATGGETSVPPESYAVAYGLPGRLKPEAPWPAPARDIGGVRIDFTAGYAGAIPAPLNQAVLMLTAHFFETREAALAERFHSIPDGVEALLAPYRQVRL